MDYLQVAEKFTGIPYQHNGRSKQGVDCWGVVYLFFRELGISLPRGDGQIVSEDWYKIDPARYEKRLAEIGEQVGHFQNLKPLDILYFRLYRNVVTHTAVMLDEQHFLHVLNGKESSIDTMTKRFWRKKYAGGIRLNLPKME